MSEQAMAALVAAMAGDDGLRARLAAATTAEDVVRIAGEAGFVITADDLEDTRQVSDADLEAVAGGTVWTAGPPCMATAGCDTYNIRCRWAG